MKNRIISLFLLLFSTLPATAEYFRNLGLQNGLSQPSVLSIAQDGLGRMWFGTQEGINMYDGEQITYVKGEITNADGEKLWIGNYVPFIVHDIDGDIFFIADNNLFGYDIHTSTFKQYTTDNATTALAVYQNEIWYARKDSLFAYDCRQHTVRSKVKLPPYTVNTLAISETNIYVGMMEGMYIIPQNTLQPSRFLLENIDVYCIFESSDEEVWIGTRMQGLYRLKDNVLQKVPYALTGSAGIRNMQIRAFVEDDEHNIWFGTFVGLQKYDVRKQTYTLIQIPQYVGGLNHPSIFSLYTDRQGTIWIGSFYGGVNYFTPDRSGFVHYDYQAGNLSNLYYSYIGEMTADKHGNLWVSTDGGGLGCINENWELVHQFTAGGLNSIPHNNVKSICYDRENDYLYIGTHLGGLSRYDFQEKSFYNYLEHQLENTPAPRHFIYQVKMWNGKLYLSSREGVFQLDPVTNHFTFLFKPESYCINFDIDAEGNFYANQADKVVIVHLSDVTQRSTLKLQDMGYKGSISHVRVTKDGVYICTLGSGLLFYDRNTKKMIVYNTENSTLPSNYCYNVKQTASNKFILTGDRGIILFDPKEQSFTSLGQKEVYLKAPIIRDCGIYVSSDNKIYIGDTKGVTLLAEEEFHASQVEISSLYFSTLHVNNRLIKPSPENKILTAALPFTKRLMLDTEDNNLLIKFAHSDYQNKYAQQGFEYKLEGLDKVWTFTPTPEARYTNLDPGDYTLYVRMAYASGQLPIQLAIHIATPWYATWWAWIFYMITIVSGITYYARNRFVKQALAQSLEKERIEKQHIEEMNHAKLVFFTNVSHEFRTPLTLIVSHIDTLLQNQLLPPQVYNKILKIKQSAQQMTNLVSELLDFRRFTQNRFILQIEKRDIGKFLKEIFLSFSDFAHQRNICYDFQCNPVEIVCWFDAKQLEKVFFNLLSNAFKYTPDGGKIGMIIATDNGNVKIQICDTGSGISDLDSAHIFDRFYQGGNQKGNEQSPGTGIGLASTKSIVEKHHGAISVESEIGKGSTFTIALSLNMSIYQEDEHIQFVDSVSDMMTTTGPLLGEKIASFYEVPVDSLSQETAKENDRKLLLVEDNKELLQILKQLFEPFYQVYLANNGKEGLAQAYEHKPNLIISDIMMPEMTGIEMCLQIKNNVDLCHIPIILLTALNNTEQSIEGLNRGADDYISKPFNAQLLLARANNLVRNRLLIQHQLRKKPLSEIDLTSINPLDQEMLRKTSQIIEKHIDDPDFDIPELCKEVGIGRSLLYSKFKALTGMTPNNFVLNYRLKHAATLLRRYSDLPIAEVSDRCGFSSPVYFSRCFKNQYGCTPQSYQKRKDSEV